MWMFLCLLLVCASLKAVDSVSTAYNYSFDVDGEAHDGYFISFEIGTPPQPVSLVIDTGSSNFAVAASEFQQGSFFNWTQSKTFQATNKTLTIRYTEGSWSGFIGYDRVQLCPGPEPWCSFDSQFACITDSTNMFAESSSWMGILGLAYPAIAKPANYVIPFFTELIENHFLTANIFALSLCGPFLENKGKEPKQGKLHLGHVDSEYFQGDIIYTPVVKEWYYEVTLTGLKVGDVAFDQSCMELNNDKTIVDSGTTFLAFPPSVHEWISDHVKHVMSATSMSFPNDFWTGQSSVCSNHEVISAFPSITLDFYHTVNSSFSIILTPDLYLLKFELLENHNLCYKFGLSPSKKGTIIGAIVLKGFYVVFDQGQQRIGFANSTCSEAATVTLPVYKDASSLLCHYVYKVSLALKILSYALVTVALAFTLPLLYMLSSWIYHNIWKPRYSSETSSLVSETL